VRSSLTCRAANTLAYFSRTFLVEIGRGWRGILSWAASQINLFIAVKNLKGWANSDIRYRAKAVVAAAAAAVAVVAKALLKNADTYKKGKIRPLGI